MASDPPILRLRRLLEADIPHPLPTPYFATSGAAGLDLSCASPGDVVIDPGRFVRVPTGFSMAIPSGYEGQIRPRSGWAARTGLTILNAPGTIDADYRGPVEVLLINQGDRPVRIRRGDRIAQLVIATVTQPTIQIVSVLDFTERGDGGFGHTGH